MSKVQRFCDYQHQIEFNSFQNDFLLFQQEFYASKLGQIYQAIPWNRLVQSLGLKEHTKGPQPIFSPRGKIALMFLKHYACCSDEDLLEQLNANIHYQFFCDIYLPLGNKLKNHKLISDIRCEIAGKLDIEREQKELSVQWLPYMEDLRSATTDATCYESAVRYPTNQKLLWESVNWSYRQMKELCSVLQIKLPRTKYNKWAPRYYQYARKRRKPAKDKRVLTRALLNLLNKLSTELDIIEQEHCFETDEKYYRKRALIKKVYQQQYQLFTTGEKPKGRIISLSKSYLRPIVRGKEIKKVEYGAKLNKVQIDGISFIEHLCFDAFNEGTHFKSSVFLAQRLTSKKLKIMGADAIYATNANRRFATRNNIQTDFVRKGRTGKHEEERLKMSKMIKKERASRLEGSFGKDKMHYYLQNIRARTEKTEILWIFFGIHTANALEIGRRMNKAKAKKAA